MHIARLTRSIDHINPSWLTRGMHHDFEGYQVSHCDLPNTYYKDYINKVNIGLRVDLDSYYTAVNDFNSYGTELGDGLTKKHSEVADFVRTGANLIRTAFIICEQLEGIIDIENVKKVVFQNVKEKITSSKDYSLTVANTAQLNHVKLAKLKSKIIKGTLDKGELIKYPMPNYVLNLSPSG